VDPGVPTGPPGTVLGVESLPVEWVPGAVSALKLTYWTSGPSNVPALSSGAVFTPPGPVPSGGWPVVSWGHGAVGIADSCAPTNTGGIGGKYLAHWLSQGYAVVATDYLGVGAERVQPYLDGRSEAHSMVDMVRAARAVEPTLSSAWIAVGQSQGGQAAMFTAALATAYAPELDFRGTIATGVPSNIEELAPLGGPGFPRLPLTGTTVFISYLLAGMRVARPDIDLASYLSPLGVAVLDRVRQLCYPDAAAELSNVSIGDLFSRRPDSRVLDAVRDMLAIPTRGYDRPLFIGQGLFDDIVPTPLTLKLVADLTANGQQFTFIPYPAGHVETVWTSLPDATRFAHQHLPPR
jgi:hypothetical protein